MAKTTDSTFLSEKKAGVLMHVTSLPGGCGVGACGASAFQFVDWMVQAGLSYWQILPLVPAGAGYSPYSSWSSMAGNTMLIDLYDLQAKKLLPAGFDSSAPKNSSSANFAAVSKFYDEMLSLAYSSFEKGNHPQLKAQFEEFLSSSDWVADASLYSVLRTRHNSGWSKWPAAEKNPDEKVLKELHKANANKVKEQCFFQFLFDSQWMQLKAYANAQGVQLVGDVPIYVDHDSCDVWLNQGLFNLGSSGNPISVSGVPPDNFSATGQLWGHPTFKWEKHHEEGYSWWQKRMNRSFEQTDIVRIDHFRGFSGYWSVKFGSEDATSGVWEKGPGLPLFQALHQGHAERFANGKPVNEVPLPVIAEDLGDIDDAVRKLKADAKLPGMCVLQFGFNSNEDEIHHPSQHPEFSVSYTGTHDNETTVQWLQSMSEKAQTSVQSSFNTLGESVEVAKMAESKFARKFVELLYSTPAKLAVVPLQDFLGLGKEARMNFPSTVEKNWIWRASESEISMNLALEIRELLSASKRL